MIYAIIEKINNPNSQSSSNYLRCELCNFYKKLCKATNNNVAYLYKMMINEQFELEKNMKNSIELRKNWHETKEKLKRKFAKLTDNDLLFVEGKQDDVVKKLQVKLGKSKEEILKIITTL